MRKRKDAGFTLLEIMIAVAIVVMFSTIVGVGVTRVINSAKIDKTKVQIKSFETGLETFRIHCLKYPGSDLGLKALVEKPGDCEAWAGPYLSSKNLPKDPWGHEYIFTSPGVTADYDLASGGPDGAMGGGDDITLSDIQ